MSSENAAPCSPDKVGLSLITRPTKKQKCIPVGCVPPAYWPSLISRRIPCMPPPGSNHACPHTHEQPCMPPGSNHTHPPEQPHMPPEQKCTPPEQPRMPPPPEQPHMPPRATTHAPQANPQDPPPPVDRMTDMCKNITFANYVCGR